MLTRKTVENLYVASGFTSKPVLVHRMLGLPAADLDSVLLGPSESCEGCSTHNDIAFERKMFAAKRAARLISYLPFVRAIAVCNSLGFQMVHEESDIDLFIITAKNRVWSARWWVTGVLALLRMRPGETNKDPICVSFFVDESVTDLSDLMIERDVYFTYWLRSLMPLVGEHILFAQGALVAPEFRSKKHFSKIREFIAGLLSENFVRKQQMNIMPTDVKNQANNEETMVVLTDRVIKLHQNDRRVELRDKIFS